MNKWFIFLYLRLVICNMENGKQQQQRQRQQQQQKRLNKDEKQKQLKILMQWVTESLKNNFAPRAVDVVEYARGTLGFIHLPRKEIIHELRLHRAYEFTSQQQRKRGKDKIYRSILVNSIGNLHGDVALYPIVREYETPKTFKTGYLICVDILTRQTFVTLLKGKKDTEHFIAAFKRIFKQFSEKNEGISIKSMGFDQETAVIGEDVQKFLTSKNITFYAFTFTSSKAKRAEGGIGLMRREVERLADEKPNVRWWNLIDEAAESLNQKPIYFNGKKLFQADEKTPFTPNTVNPENLKYFLTALNKAGTGAYFDQFNIKPQSVKFKFNVGDYVRAKLIVTSSKVIGEKRSAKSLTKAIFRIVDRKAVKARKKSTIINQYICQLIPGGQIETLGEDDIALIRYNEKE